MVSKFSNIMNWCSPKISGIFFGFGCPGIQDKTSLLELLVSCKFGVFWDAPRCRV